MERGMNERIRKLRRQSESTPPKIYLERAVLETEAYRKYEGTVSVPELRALTLLYIMEHKTLCINDGELIVGEKGDGPQSSPTFPELCCHTLEDMHVMNDRELVSFKVSEEDLKIQEKQIIPFWKNRSIRRRILESVSPKWKDCYESGIFTEFMEQRGPGHTVGSENIFLKGFQERKADVRQSAAVLLPWQQVQVFIYVTATRLKSARLSLLL